MSISLKSDIWECPRYQTSVYTSMHTITAFICTLDSNYFGKSCLGDRRIDKSDNLVYTLILGIYHAFSCVQLGS